MNVKTKRNQQKCKDDKKTDECDVDRCKKLAVDARLKNRLYNRFKHWSYEILRIVRLALVWTARIGKYWPGVPRAQTPFELVPNPFNALANARSLITHHAGHISLTYSARIYRISSNNSRGRLFLFSLQKGAIIRGRLLFQILLTESRALIILFYLYPIK